MLHEALVAGAIIASALILGGFLLTAANRRKIPPSAPANPRPTISPDGGQMTSGSSLDEDRRIEAELQNRARLPPLRLPAVTGLPHCSQAIVAGPPPQLGLSSRV